ncbi:MAG: hypothetical protein ABSC08_09600, partial [Bryobacteraceae bacterium]
MKTLCQRGVPPGETRTAPGARKPSRASRFRAATVREPVFVRRDSKERARTPGLTAHAPVRGDAKA